MKEERDRFLTEAQGECWHEWGNDPLYKQCVKCRKYLPSADLEKFRSIELTHIDFSTWPGFGVLWEWVIKQDFFPSFYLSTYLLDEKNLKTDFMGEIIANIVSDIVNPDRFADAVYKFLKNPH